MLFAVTPQCERCGCDNLCHTTMPLHSNAKVTNDLVVAVNQRLLVCHRPIASVGAVVLDRDNNILADDCAGGGEHHLELADESLVLSLVSCHTVQHAMYLELQLFDEILLSNVRVA